MKSTLIGSVKKSLIRDVLLESNFCCLYNKDKERKNNHKASV